MKDDAISRQAAKLKVARVIWEDGESFSDFHDKCVDCLDDVPSAQTEPLVVTIDHELTKDDCYRWKQAMRDTPILLFPSAQPEPCEDAVSRKAVEEMLQSGFPARGMWEIEGDVVKQTVCETLADALMDLEKLPSVTPKGQRWIPVSERLPEDEYVLISKKPTKISGSKWCVAIAIRTADPRSRKIQWRDSGFGVIQDDKVLAWMPLPEPYREEGDRKWKG